jgi:ribosome-associated protein
VASKATLRWSVGASGVYSEEQKQLIREYAGSYLNKADEIIIQANEQRSQHQNRDSASERLQNLVAQALVPKKLRKATKPSWGSKQKRLDSKRMDSNKKNGRRKGGDDF